jgi:ATP-binding cassette subfamily B protein
LVGYLRPYRTAVIGSLILLFVTSAMTVAGPWVIARIIDGPVAQKDVSGLAFWSMVYLGILAVQFIIQFFHMLITQWIGQKAMLDMRTQLFDHLLKLDMKFFDRNPVGRLLTRVTGDINQLNELFASGVVTIFGDLLTLTAIVIAMVYLNPKMALITFAVLPILGFATWLFKRRVREAYRDVRRLVARINSFWQEHVTGIAVVQGFNREEETNRQHQERNADVRGAHFRSVLHYAVFYPVVELIGAISLALIVWYGGGQVVQGAMTFGALAAFIQYAERFYAPIRDLAEKYNVLQGAMASSERIFKLLDTEPTLVMSSSVGSTTADSEDSGAVVFENVWFAYVGEDWVLQDVSFRVNPGETVAIVGATGSGKTSIANLVTRLYEFQKGRVTVDGLDVRSWDPQALRRRVGMISQDVFLFSGQISDNLRLDDESISNDVLAGAAARVGLSRLVEGDGDSLTRRVGERGSGLSVGEKQLVAFARAVAFDPGILILDEATSSVDHRTEEQIQTAIGEVFAGRTNIVIAHRLSTIRSAARIIVLHKGRIRETGNHDELIAEDGIYARLYHLQEESNAMKSTTERVSARV